MAAPEQTYASAGPQLTWTNVVATIVAICVIAGGAYKIIEVQFDAVRQTSETAIAELNRQIALNRLDIERTRTEYLALREYEATQLGLRDNLSTVHIRLTSLENQQRDILLHAAHSPVEAKEVDQLSSSVDKRLELMQQQLNDINRQIAASILQNSIPSHPQLLPK